MNKSIKYAKIYAIASVFIGPAIVFLLSGNHPSGWDCTDSTWSDNISIIEREAIYEHGSRLMGPAAIVMLLVGAVLFATLVYLGEKKRTTKTMFSACLVLIMMLGYGSIILLATSRWC